MNEQDKRQFLKDLKILLIQLNYEQDKEKELDILELIESKASILYSKYL